MSKEKAFKIALFGAGRIGKVHAVNIAAHPETALKYVIDPATGPAGELAAKYGASVGDENAALNDPEISAILVASDTTTHASMIEKGLKAGKAVFCEKPVDLSIKRVNACLKAIAGIKLPLLIGFNRRFDPGIAEMQKRIKAGVIGELELLTIISKDPGPPPLSYIKVSGGLFRDMTIHDFDMARFILGEEPASVVATAAVLVDPAIGREGDIDTASVTLQCPSGKIAVITNSRRATFGYDQRVEAHGSLGMLRADNIPTHNLVQERADGVVHEKPLFFFLERYAQSYATEWAHFVRALKGEETASPSGEDGRRALLLADAAYESLKSGRRIDVAN